MSKEFIWTDALVKEYLGTALKDTIQDMEYFKASHQPKEDYIPSGAGLHVPDYLPNNPKVVSSDYQPKEDGPKENQKK